MDEEDLWQLWLDSLTVLDDVEALRGISTIYRDQLAARARRDVAHAERLIFQAHLV